MTYCVAAVDAGDGTHRSCSAESVTHRGVKFDGWAVTVWLCSAHAALWDADIAKQDFLEVFG